MKGVIFDIKRFALHDGPGIRTTAFFKGCPLNCEWCHNPESQGFGVETLTGRQGDVTVGREVSVDEVASDLERDRVFYEESGGGVTFSGGEPLSQPEFLAALLDQCGTLGLHRAVDTCGHAPREVILNVASRTDLFLYDLKLADGELHTRYTGVDTEQIHGNLVALCETEVPIELRIPVIPGITDSPENLEALGSFAASLPRALPVRLLAYHRWAMDKYTRFSLKTPMLQTPEPSGDEMETCRSKLAGCGMLLAKGE